MSTGISLFGTWCLQVVDLVMFTKFEAMDSAAVTEDPLIFLGCGHIFTRSTLDGVVDLSKWVIAGGLLHRSFVAAACTHEDHCWAHLIKI
jgi:hypothetical protein